MSSELTPSGPIYTALSRAKLIGAAEDAWRFRWQAGQVLSYRVDHQTQATETGPEGKAETKTRLTLTKRWMVQAVDASGVATVQHSLTALRMELTTPGGETLLFDSAAPDESEVSTG